MTTLRSLCWILFSQHPFWTRGPEAGHDADDVDEVSNMDKRGLTTSLKVLPSFFVLWWDCPGGSYTMQPMSFPVAPLTFDSQPAPVRWGFSYPRHRTLYFSLLNFLTCILYQCQASLCPLWSKLFHVACGIIIHNEDAPLSLHAGNWWCCNIRPNISPTLILEPSGPANLHLTQQSSLPACTSTASFQECFRDGVENRPEAKECYIRCLSTIPIARHFITEGSCVCQAQFARHKSLPFSVFGSGLKRLCFLRLPRAWDKADCTMSFISKTGTVPAQSPGTSPRQCDFCGWSSVSVSAPWGESYSAPWICLHPAPLSSPCSWPPPSIPSCWETHGALVHAEKSTSAFSHMSCHLVVSLTLWWTHSVHYGLPHLGTVYLELPWEPSRYPALSVGSLQAQGS